MDLIIVPLVVFMIGIARIYLVSNDVINEDASEELCKVIQEVEPQALSADLTVGHNYALKRDHTAFMLIVKQLGLSR